jgi:hypothetical protein
MQTVSFEHYIRGYVVGPIWWPVGTEAWKHLTYDITDQDARWSEPGTLRDHALRALNDGDFQSCSIAAGELVTIATIQRNGRTYTRRESRPLTCFPSIADCLHEDPDWCPPCDEE